VTTRVSRSGLKSYRGKAKKIGTRQAAEAVKREIEARLAFGDLGFLTQDDPKTPTFGEYADSWTKHHLSRHVKPSTAYFYAQYLRLHVRPAFADTRLDQIHRQAVKDWIVDLTSHGLSRNTVRLAVSSLRVVLTGAIEDGLIRSNPAHKLGRAIKVEKPEREATALTPQEAARFLKATKEFCPQPLCFLSHSVANRAARGRTGCPSLGRHTIRRKRGGHQPLPSRSAKL
jgi:integrase